MLAKDGFVGQPHASAVDVVMGAIAEQTAVKARSGSEGEVNGKSVEGAIDREVSNLNFIPFEIISTCRGGGYMYCRTVPPHPKRNAKGLYPLHRVLAENKAGRILESWEHVHHKDEDKTNDTPDNLEVLTIDEHGKHHAMHTDLIDVICGFCGKPFQLKPHVYKQRLSRNKHGKCFCSRACGTSYNKIHAEKI